MQVYPDHNKVIRLNDFIRLYPEDKVEIEKLRQRAERFLGKYRWLKKVSEEYVGMCFPGIISIFLFHIVPARPDVDDWIWVVVGDIPSAYITCDNARSPGAALDGYIAEMAAWVAAAEKGESVEEFIPVNVPATPQNAAMLASRLKFLENR